MATQDRFTGRLDVDARFTVCVGCGAVSVAAGGLVVKSCVTDDAAEDTTEPQVSV